MNNFYHITTDAKMLVLFVCYRKMESVSHMKYTQPVSHFIYTKTYTNHRRLLYGSVVLNSWNALRLKRAQNVCPNSFGCDIHITRSYHNKINNNNI